MDLVMNDRIHDGTPDAEGSTCKISSSDLLVEVDNVTVRYMLPRSFLSTERRTLLALDRVSLSVARGQTLGIVGATGSGKSTIAKLIMGMISPTSGTVKVAGQDLASVSGPERLALQRLRQVVLQDPYSSLDPRMKVGSIIAEPLRHGPESRKLTRRAIRERVKELLLRVGMQSDKAELFPHQFSGGQRQRISIARALAPDPKLIVLDEPTSALDVSIRAQILNLLKDLQENLGVSYVIISHDLVTVAYLASTVAVMQRGRVIESGPTESIYRGARHPYTLELLASTPSASGEFLSVSDRPDDASSNRCRGGCLYADRCALRDDLGEPHRCLDEVPQLSAVTPDHFVACHFRDRDIVRNEQSGAAVDER